MARLARAQPWLGTLVEIRAEHEDELALEAAVRRAFATVARVHALMSVHEIDSALSCINRHAHTVRMPLDDDVRKVLLAALELSRRSDGVFDPTIGGSMMAAGLLPPSHEADPKACWRDVDVDDEGVTFARPLALDFGGIAKGYAVDVALSVLRSAQCNCASVNAGGDLARFGPEAETIHVRDPRGSYLPLLQLRCGAVATSCYANYGQSAVETAVTPLIDTRCRRSVARGESVTISAGDCMTADALTKVVMLLGAAASEVLSSYQASAMSLSCHDSELSVMALPQVQDVQDA